MSSLKLSERLVALMLPAILLSIAVRSFISVSIETLLQRNRPLSEVRDEAFARFWNIISPPTPPGTVLLGSAALVPPLLATAEGTVLEMGPGSGVQVQYFAAAKAANRIYGAEPCLPLHKALLSSAREAGLAEKYSIVTAGAEKETLIPGLANAGLLAKHQDGGVFDTIVCVRVLCSVQGLDETCETLYKLLKPGGKILVVEHCVNPWQDPKGSYVARLLQTFYSLLGWSFFVGNCHLTRDIKRALIEAAAMHGGWERDDLENYFGWAALPYVSGTLVKRRK